LEVKVNEQENIWSEKENVKSQTTSLAGSDVGHCKDKAESKNSSATTTVATSEAQSEIVEG
jgi:hypothetical protein